MDERPNPDPELVESRAAALLPEEAAAGSDNPEAQAAAVLEESEERTLERDAELDDAEHRHSEDTVPPVE